MRIIRGLTHIRPDDRGVAVTLGNFDGVHRGHQALLSALREAAPGLRRCVVCFEPQPLECLNPGMAPVRLQSLSEKLRSLRDLGLEQVLVLRFDHALSHMPAEDFVRRVLIDGLAMRHLVVGDDYRFGHQRRGDFALLQALSGSGTYALQRLDTIVHEADRVSSTRIREALAAGQLQQAVACLGRPYSLRGRVVHGQKLGRKLGAPTANVALRRRSPLRHGVYCVRLNGCPAVANIGLRPTAGGDGGHLEVHLLQGAHDLYDQMVRVDFEQFLRPERRFEDLEQLQQAIATDVAQARAHFSLESA